MPHLSPDKRAFLDKIAESTSELEKLSHELTEERNSVSLNALSRHIPDLRRKIREFDSDLFIIVSLGMLKSGKSSLVNLLSRSTLASPTGYGFDTTLRPALIMTAPENTPEEGRIIVWFAKEKEDFTEALDDVIDHIRGISPEVTRATHVVHPLTQENLNALLCQTCAQAGNLLYQEPVLVVVQTPRHEDALLSDKVVLLDTPGLDSHTSTWTRDSRWYEWIIRRCDLLLFLQSSVAPLNEKANTVLQNILEKNRKASIWLIQNQMEAKHWYAPEVIRADHEKQASHATKLFRQVAPHFTARMLKSNLGKAYTSLLEPNPDLSPQINGENKPAAETLRSESEFDVLQEHLTRELSENADASRLKNCLGDLTNANQDVWASWKAHQASLNRVRQELEDKIRQIDWEKESFLRQLSILHGDLLRPDELDIALPWNTFRELLQNRFHAVFTSEKIGVDQINRFIDEMKTEAAQVEREAVEALRAEFLMVRRGGSGRSLKSCIEENVDEFLTNCRAQFTSGREILMPLESLSRDDAPHELSTGFYPQALQEGFFPHRTKESTWLLFEKKLTKTEVEALLLTAPTSLSEKLKTHFRDESHRLSVQITAWAEEQRLLLILNYKEKVAELAEMLKQELRNDQARLDHDLELGSTAEQLCNEIANQTANLH